MTGCFSEELQDATIRYINSSVTLFLSFKEKLHKCIQNMSNEKKDRFSYGLDLADMIIEELTKVGLNIKYIEKKNGFDFVTKFSSIFFMIKKMENLCIEIRKNDHHFLMINSFLSNTRTKLTILSADMFQELMFN